MSTYRTRNLYFASYLVAEGYPFPSVEREPERGDGRPGRPTFVFDDDDPEHSVGWSEQEYPASEAARLFHSFDLLKRAMGPRPGAPR